MADNDGGTSTVSAEDFDKEVSKRQRAEAELVDLKKRMDAFKDIDPERVRADREALERLQKEKTAGDPKALEEWQTSKEAEIKGRFDKKLTEYEATNAELLKKLTRLEVVNPAMRKAADLINPTELDMVEILVERDLMLIDGKICVRGKDDKPAPSVKNPREDMGLEEYLEELAEKHPAWARSTMQPGGKQPGNTSGNTAGSLSAEKYVKMSREDQLKLPVKERGKLAREAMRAGLI